MPLSHVHANRDGDAGEDLTIRRAGPADAVALETLATLDSARPLAGDRLVAVVDGRMVAAVSLDDGRVVADPFYPSAPAVEILRTHTAGARSGAARPRRPLRARLVPRRAASAAA